MAYTIYYLKNQLLFEELGGVKRMADLIAIYYTKAFLESRLVMGYWIFNKLYLLMYWIMKDKGNPIWTWLILVLLCPLPPHELGGFGMNY